MNDTQITASGSGISQDYANPRTPFCYAILRYRHDTSLDEFLNVGAVVGSPDCSSVGIKINRDTAALQAVFDNFSEFDFERIASGLERCAQNPERPRSFSEMLEWMIPDTGLSYCFSEVRGGLLSRRSGESYENQLDWIYERTITKTRPQKITAISRWRRTENEQPLSHPVMQCQSVEVEVRLVDDDGDVLDRGFCSFDFNAFMWSDGIEWTHWRPIEEESFAPIRAQISPNNYSEGYPNDKLLRAIFTWSLDNQMPAVNITDVTFAFCNENGRELHFVKAGYESWYCLKIERFRKLSQERLTTVAGVEEAFGWLQQ